MPRNSRSPTRISSHFSYSISHDLRAPLLFVKDFALRLERDFAAQLGGDGQHVVQVISEGCRSMDEMVVGCCRSRARHASR